MPVSFVEVCGIKYAVVDGAYHFVDFVTGDIEELTLEDMM